MNLGRSLLSATLLALLTAVQSLHAQPYVYSVKSTDTCSEIVRLDLRKGSFTHIKSVQGVAGPVTDDPSGRWLFYPLNGALYATALRDTANTAAIPLSTDHGRIVAFLLHSARYIVDPGRADGDTTKPKFLVLDSQLAEISTITHREVVACRMALPTPDERMLLFTGYDSSAASEYLGAYGLESGIFEWKKILIDLSPIGVQKRIVDGADGFILMSWPGKKKLTTYQVYDPTDGVFSPAVVPPWKANVRLSPDARKIIAQQLGKDSKLAHVRVYDVKTGKLLRKISFPAGGEVRLFFRDRRSVYYTLGERWFKAPVAQGKAVRGQRVGGE